MSDKIEPHLDDQNSDSILDEINREQDHIEEEVARPNEKVSPFRLLTNDKNKKLFLLFLFVIAAGIVIVVFAFTSLSEIEKQSPKLGNQNYERVLPDGNLTPAQLEEVERYNKENLSSKDQPIALENRAKENAEVLDGSFADEDSDIDEVSGCDLGDTACMRLKMRIAPDACAPKDALCLSALEAKQRASLKTIHSAPPELSEHDRYLQRLRNDPEYLKALAGKVKTATDEKKQLVVRRGEIYASIEPDTNDQTNQDQSTLKAIDAGILKQTPELFKKLISSGDRLMGSADIALNSKIQSEASFTIFGGEFLESKMLGTTKRVDDYMRVELDKWVLPDKRECKIKAIALDKTTTYAAVASRVDHHTLYRYGWWGLGTTLKVIGAAAEANASREVVIVDSTVIDSVESDSKREMKMAIGNLGEEIGNVMQKRLDTPSTVFVDIGETVGIFFIEPVTTNDCKFGGMNSETGSQANNS